MASLKRGKLSILKILHFEKTKCSDVTYVNFLYYNSQNFHIPPGKHGEIPVHLFHLKAGHYPVGMQLEYAVNTG